MFSGGADLGDRVVDEWVIDGDDGQRVAAPGGFANALGNDRGHDLIDEFNNGAALVAAVNSVAKLR
jgi:hypothetical protein